MLCAAFIFNQHSMDDAFRQLDALIERAAEETDGYLGVDRWIEAEGERRNSTYYWRDEVALKSFSANPHHLEAKRRYKQWYSGFHIIISQVQKTYGDGALEISLPNERRQR